MLKRNIQRQHPSGHNIFDYQSIDGYFLLSLIQHPISILKIWERYPIQYIHTANYEMLSQQEIGIDMND